MCIGKMCNLIFMTDRFRIYFWIWDVLFFLILGLRCWDDDDKDIGDFLLSFEIWFFLGFWYEVILKMMNIMMSFLIFLFYKIKF